MLHYFTFVTETARRRHELERAVESEARAALGWPEMRRPGWPHLLRQVWTSLAAGAASRWPRILWWSGGAPMNTNQRSRNQWNAATR